MSATEHGSGRYPELVRALRAAGCVFAEDEARLLLSDNPTDPALAEMVAGRVAGRPLEHVLGWAEFCGARYAVDPGVFVPRRRTEFLVDRAVALARSALPSGRQGVAGPTGSATDVGRVGSASDPVRDGSARRADRVGAALLVLDLCCGAGAIGAAVAAALPGCELHAADIDPAAVRCASRNVAGQGRVHLGDLYDALPLTLRGRVDLLLVNAPYVPTDEIRLMPTEARQYEATVALDGGSDGLDIQRRVIAQAPQWLAPGGYLLIETSERQAPSTAAAFDLGGLTPRIERSEELDATVVIGVLARSG